MKIDCSCWENARKNGVLRGIICGMRGTWKRNDKFIEKKNGKFVNWNSNFGVALRCAEKLLFFYDFCWAAVVGELGKGQEQTNIRT